MSFQNRLKSARESKNMTLKELAKKIGKTEATVQRYESGEIKNLKNDIVEKMAEVLEVSPAYLMGWSDGPKYSSDQLRVAAHIDDDVTEDQMQNIIKYIEFLKSQHKDE
ncbi:helix-turn-helix transcriptional regulator [Ignavigranum ruoffiae]|uniref:helix-turn-helix domain-containing protein n=1 Tax=Ignavigranum ruoffiae TaxID=89093 RepID=UPI002356BF9F|nr:helix-turn-helix transcriptional regulator [Ignavigranum ruoffiae]